MHAPGLHPAVRGLGMIIAMHHGADHHDGLIYLCFMQGL